MSTRSLRRLLGRGREQLRRRPPERRAVASPSPTIVRPKTSSSCSSSLGSTAISSATRSRPSTAPSRRRPGRARCSSTRSVVRSHRSPPEGCTVGRAGVAADGVNARRIRRVDTETSTLGGHDDRTGPHEASDPPRGVPGGDEPHPRRVPARLEPDRPPGAAGRGAERPARLDRRRGLRQPEHLRRPDPDAELHPHGRAGSQVQPVPRDGPVLAHPRRAADRSQQPRRGVRLGR